MIRGKQSRASFQKDRKWFSFLIGGLKPFQKYVPSTGIVFPQKGFSKVNVVAPLPRYNYQDLLKGSQRSPTTGESKLMRKR